MQQAVAEATRDQRRFAEEDDVICAKGLREDGVDLIELTAAERAEFTAATRAEVDATRGRFSSDLIALFESDIAEANKGAVSQ